LWVIKQMVIFMRIFLYNILLSFLVACNSKKVDESFENKNIMMDTITEGIYNRENNLIIKNTAKEAYSSGNNNKDYIDSIELGESSNYKVLITISEIDTLWRQNIMPVKLECFVRHENRWILRQVFNYDQGTLSGGELFSKDLNGDNFNDLLVSEGSGARGANVFYRLYIFDPIKENLIYIKNSTDYPNIDYNQSMKCIDAWAIYSGSSTIFLKITGDSLKEFAKINLFDGLKTKILIDSSGQSRIIEKTKISDEDYYFRFSNFNE